MPKPKSKAILVHRKTDLLSMEFRAYVESGDWRCDKSPTGAHHWIISNGTQRCVYCGCTKSLKPLPPVISPSEEIEQTLESL